ncbi:MAG: GNAT family N-acetyltransferase [Oxalobacter formigenes]|nr:GNAT family N-acetyltransferase [Oxalobacter formigenes]
MKIRQITASDITPLVSLGRQFFDESPYAAFMEYDLNSARVSVEKILASGVGLLVESEKGIHGFAGGLPVGMWFNRSHSIMNCLAVWVEPEYAGKPVGCRLIQRFIETCRKKGYEQIMFADLALVRGETVAGVYQRMGMKRLETSWILA